jgi:hypothetical protein
MRRSVDNAGAGTLDFRPDPIQSGPIAGYDTRFFRLCSVDGIADIAELRKAFTASPERNTEATSESSTAAIVPPASRSANLFGRDFE